MSAWEVIATYPSTIEDHVGVFFNNRMNIICGYSSDASDEVSVFGSTQDGKVFDRLLSPFGGVSKRAFHAACVFDNKIFISGGAADSVMKSEVLSSSDGNTFIHAGALPVATAYHKMVEFNNQLVVLGGMNEAAEDLNTIYTSINGLVWTRIYPKTPWWSARNDFAAVVFKNKLWVYGGYGDGVEHNDVWWTDDLVNWHRSIEAAPWEARSQHGYCVWDERMWLIGGDGNSLYTDVWFSRDGCKWEQGLELPYHLCETFVGVIDNRLHIFGGVGNSKSTLRLNMG